MTCEGRLKLQHVRLKKFRRNKKFLATYNHRLGIPSPLVREIFRKAQNFILITKARNFINLFKSIISKPFTIAKILRKFHYMRFGGEAGIRVINLDLSSEKRKYQLHSALIYFPIHVKSRFLIDGRNLMKALLNESR